MERQNWASDLHARFGCQKWLTKMVALLIWVQVLGGFLCHGIVLGQFTWNHREKSFNAKSYIFLRKGTV